MTRLLQNSNKDTVMGKLEELIQKYCPDGVEYRPLVECCNILDGKRKPITKGARQPGPYPYYGANGIQDWVADYIFDGIYVLVGEDGSVITPSGTPVVNWAEGKIWVNNHAHIIAEKPGVLLRFLYFFIQTIDIHNLVHGNIPKLTQGDLNELEIPIPPFPVQEEIVRVLDTFTELQAELQAELQKRLQQYNYYRDNLLTYFTPEQEAKEYSLGELFEFKNGLNASKEQFGHGKPIVNYVNVYKKNSIFSSDLSGLVELDASSIERYRVQRGDVFFTRTSETKEEVGIASVLLEDIEDCVFSGFVLRARPTTGILLPEFCKYCFATNSIRKQIIQSSTLTTRALTNGKSLSKVKIMVPNLSAQQSIVDILDRFYTLTTDLSQGLPAEIEKRRLQYEFYRDKLLTFKRKEA